MNENEIRLRIIKITNLAVAQVGDDIINNKITDFIKELSEQQTPTEPSNNPETK